MSGIQKKVVTGEYIVLSDGTEIEAYRTVDIQKEIKEALEKATPGPWENWHSERVVSVDERFIGGRVLAEALYENDAHLIANAPTWLLHQQELIEQLQDRETNHYGELIESQQLLIEQKDAEIKKLAEFAASKHDEAKFQAEGNKLLRKALEEIHSVIHSYSESRGYRERQYNEIVEIANSSISQLKGANT